MKCLTPITIKNPKRSVNSPEKAISVPCSRCANCLKRRSSGWIFRLKQEKRRSISSAFLTLTYNDDYLPISSNGLDTLDKRDLQLFFKRLRKYIGKHFPNNPSVKYYAVGEYGSKYKRPHYHAIIFNVPNALYSKLGKHATAFSKLWPLGLYDFDIANDATIAYVTDYLQFKVIKKNDPWDDRVPEFSTMSKRLGDNYITPQIKKYHKRHLNTYVTMMNGSKVSMPRYYKEKIYNEIEQVKISAKNKAYVLSQDQIDPKKELEIIKDADLKQKRNEILKRQKL